MKKSCGIIYFKGIIVENSVLVTHNTQIGAQRRDILKSVNTVKQINKGWAIGIKLTVSD